jgi:hypothetical protein
MGYKNTLFKGKNLFVANGFSWSKSSTDCTYTFASSILINSYVIEFFLRISDMNLGKVVFMIGWASSTRLERSSRVINR